MGFGNEQQHLYYAVAMAALAYMPNAHATQQLSLAYTTRTTVAMCTTAWCLSFALLQVKQWAAGLLRRRLL